ncbi:hypothetical protein CR203_06105 [Salipaludibacillus neizhouensis]|uniref:Uncharacterized protein n=1 Tax=Salipaludibacillus neizhouensis TaxID=885475 RepID=A0A3A9K665_9BACI|nr:hypothetical protein [Salipaludibacillus neizhouensis]RKL68067.1 hypothetical protein CR203_06105 [Salipaludibacillus neizhouensis]
MEFWSAEQLKEDFEIVVSFYQTEIGNNMYSCRNHAVIRRKGHANQEQPDAVVVMANPGSCPHRLNVGEDVKFELELLIKRIIKQS